MSPNLGYIYYRIYAEDGVIPSKTPVNLGDPFIGRITARSVAPPRNVGAVKRHIAKSENIKDLESTSLFFTPFSESPMDDKDMVTIQNITDPGSTPNDPLVLVAKMSDSERSALESDGRNGLASAGTPNTTPTDIRYVHYLLYADGNLMPSKMAIDTDSEDPYVARVRADYITPPHTLTSIRLYISRVEKNPALAHAHLFENDSSAAPFEEGHIPILRTDGPGLRPEEPMLIDLRSSIPIPTANDQVKNTPDPLPIPRSPDPLPVPSIPSGMYLIKNRAQGYYWSAEGANKFINFYPTTELLEVASVKRRDEFPSLKWCITQDTNRNISISSPTSGWATVGNYSAGAEGPLTLMMGSTVRSVPWRLIPSDSNFFYLTTDTNLDSQNPIVPAAKPDWGYRVGRTATLELGDLFQMWKFCPISTT